MASLGSGARQLADMDPDLGAVLDRLGEPPMWGRNPGFAALVRIILEQQAMAEEWAPWRSVAARILWMHYLDGRGQYHTPVI